MMFSIPAEDMRNVSRAASKKAGEAYETVKDAVVSGYKAVENGTVRGYKAVENAAVKGYEKTEDFFVDKLFKKEGETVDAAKERLRRNAPGGQAGTEEKKEGSDERH